jgi:putative holliday junction resolvase
MADAAAGLAQPLTTLDRVNRNEDMRRLREFVREHAITEIVVGLPLRLDGTRGQMAEEAARFAQRVHKQLGLPVQLVDERLTSWEAERQLEDTQGRLLHAAAPRGVTAGQRAERAARPTVDAMAAAIILKEYLDRPRTEPAA